MTTPQETLQNSKNIFFGPITAGDFRRKGARSSSVLPPRPREEGEGKSYLKPCSYFSLASIYYIFFFLLFSFSLLSRIFL